MKSRGASDNSPKRRGISEENIWQRYAVDYISAITLKTRTSSRLAGETRTEEVSGSETVRGRTAKEEERRKELGPSTCCCSWCCCDASHGVPVNARLLRKQV
ncbi:hypothetical protein PUN28_016104 [Cardiocondyla obscurior]|uniref:Uncharacterized protein n=1 Tax=Cardiocondyla obscurior TaxID=286306 RepID=A0AAW2ETE4_9HYME